MSCTAVTMTTGMSGILFLGPFEQADAVHFGHHQVGQHELKFLATIQQGEGFLTGSGLTTLIVSEGKHGADDLADCVFIVDHQDPFSSHARVEVYRNHT